MTTLLDTGPLVALLNARDAYHHWAVDQAQVLKPPFYSCEAVIAEAHHLLSRHPMGNRRLNQLIASGKVDLTFSYEDHTKQIHRLMETYENIPMSFADACLVRLAEVHRSSQIFTLDRDFRVYRKHRNKPLKLILPPT